MAQHHPTPSDPLAKNEERIIRKDTLKAQPGADFFLAPRSKPCCYESTPTQYDEEGGLRGYTSIEDPATFLRFLFLF